MEYLTNDILTKTKQYWNIHQTKNIFHQTVSLVISQKISFAKSRRARQILYDLIKPDQEFTSKNLSKIDKSQWLKIGIAESQYASIQNLIKLDQNNYDNKEWIEQISKIKGIGPWTIKGLKIMFNIEPDLFLFEDYWIRSRMTELVSTEIKPICMSSSNANILSSHWKGYRTLVSLFFWRIKPEGISALKNGIPLTQDYFI
jgi:3-methyladenine DNA glycosylase/8-oxoguanine DNA glycosylase